MRVKIPIFTALVLLTLVPAIPQLAVRSAHAIPGPGSPPFPYTDPSNVWSPYGPFVPRLQFNYYTDENSMFNAFQAGQLDITDWPVGRSLWPTFDGPSSISNDVILSQSQGQFGMRILDINQEGARWAGWGCDFRSISGGVVSPSPCGIQIRKALRYLIDMPQYTLDSTIQGSAVAISDPSPPAKNPAGTPVDCTGGTVFCQLKWDDQCVNGHVHTLATGESLNCGSGTVAGPVGVGGYNIANDVGGAPALCSPDERAAVDHLIDAFKNIPGHQLTSGNGCVIDASSPGRAAILANPPRFEIRSDDVQRDQAGNLLADGLDMVFGTPVVQRVEGNINQLGDTVFLSQPEGSNDDWEMYTAGWGLPGAFPDHLEALYGSLSASDQCGGPQDPETTNYSFYCDPAFDTHVINAETTSDVTTFKNQELAAFDQWGKDAMNIPAWSNAVRSVILRSVDGAVNEKGNGYGENNFQTTLNAHVSKTFKPANPIYAFGGGDNSTLRWGQKSGTKHLNPFRATTQWDQQIFFEVYDTLGAASPIDPLKTFSWMAQKIEQQAIDVNGNTPFLITLRTGVRWQDGVPVTPEDVKFSILNFKDAPSAPFVAGVTHVVSVNICATCSPHNQLLVTYRSQSVSHPLNVNGIPVIPEHLWELGTGAADPTTTCGVASCDRTAFVASGDFTGCSPCDVGHVDPNKTVAGYDPLKNTGPGAYGGEGMFIGSGPYECRSLGLPGAILPTGALGAGCASTPTSTDSGQAITGSALLVRFDRTNAATTPSAGNFSCATDTQCQYMRGTSGTWPNGATLNGIYQQWSYADKVETGASSLVVDVLDTGSVALCVGVDAAAAATSVSCPTAAYNYWVRPAIAGARACAPGIGCTGATTIIGPEAFIATAEYKDTWIYPHTWDQIDMTNITPFSSLGA